MKINKGIAKSTILVASIVLFTGCSTNDTRRAEDYMQRDDWLRAVMEYRAELERDPNNVEIRSQLRQTELKAADFYYHRGMQSLSKNNHDTAIGSFEQGLAAMPGHEKLRAALQRALSMRQRHTLVKDIERYKRIGDMDKENRTLERALKLVPGDAVILDYWRDYQERKTRASKSRLDINEREKVTLNFQDADIKSAFGFLSDTFGINVIFDSDVKGKNLTLYAKDVTFYQALDLMMSTTKTFYKRVSGQTIMIAPDTKDKRGQYQNYLIRTYPLVNMDAKHMADILKGVLSLQKVVVNDSLNSLTIRATEEDLELASRLVQANDRKPAEIVLEVEILEVNRQKAKQLGFDYGSVISLEYPAYNVSGAFTDTLAQGTVTLPTVSFRYFKQSVNAKTLANPKVRVVDGKEAKIHIGDRVPLRSSTIQDATGQTRTTFQYTDIGIRLHVEPQIQLDNSALVNLGLEVSSLGQNLGTQAEPAYSIGTRNADTYMLLRDGETAILGGLIRDEDRQSSVKVPGLGDIPVVGSLFTSVDNSSVRTDVLLTITPRIIRPWNIAPKETRVLFSGTAERYFTQPGYFDTPAGAVKPDNDVDKAQGIVTTSGAYFGLDRKTYRAASGDSVTVSLKRLAGAQGGTYPVRLRYDDELLEYDSVSIRDQSSITGLEQVAPGELLAHLKVETDKKLGTANTVADITFQAKGKGVSYLILGSGKQGNTGEPVSGFNPDSAYAVIE